MTPTLEHPSPTEPTIDSTDEPGAFPYDDQSSGFPLPTPAASGVLRAADSAETDGRAGSTACPDCSGETINGAGLFVCPDCGWEGSLR